MRTASKSEENPNIPTPPFAILIASVMIGLAVVALGILLVFLQPDLYVDYLTPILSRADADRSTDVFSIAASIIVSSGLFLLVAFMSYLVLQRCARNAELASSAGVSAAQPIPEHLKQLVEPKPTTTSTKAKAKRRKRIEVGVEKAATGGRVFSREELALYTGLEPAYPAYVCLDGQVFDVSSRPDFYGPQGGYHLFVGKEAARAFALNSVKAEDCNGDIGALDQKQLDSLRSWQKFYKEKYPFVGTLAK